MWCATRRLRHLANEPESRSLPGRGRYFVVNPPAVVVFPRTIRTRIGSHKICCSDCPSSSCSSPSRRRWRPQTSLLPGVGIGEVMTRFATTLHRFGHHQQSSPDFESRVDPGFPMLELREPREPARDVDNVRSGCARRFQEE